MNCKKTQDYLSPYLDHFLSQEEMRLVEKHLERCPVCRQELEDLKETVHLIKTLPECPLPVDFGKELHHKLMISKEEKGQEESIWRRSFFNLLSFRNKWAPLGMAAVLMVFLYAFFAPFLLAQREQSDMPLNVRALNQEKADFSLNGNLELTEDQLPNLAMDTQEKSLENREEKLPQKEQIISDHDTVNLPEKSIQNKEIASSVVKDENQKVESTEQIRENPGEAARGNNGAEEKTPIFRMAAIAPEQSIDSVKEKNILPDQDFQLMIIKDGYEEFFDWIKGLRAELTDVLDVAYQNIDEETKGFIILVAKGAVPQVRGEINAMNSAISSVNQDVYLSDLSNTLGESVPIRIIIKEKID